MSASDPVVIVGMARTPMGAMLGELAGFSANELGALAIKGAVAEAGIKGEDVELVYMGNCLPAGQGQAPARAVAIHAAIEFRPETEGKDIGLHPAPTPHQKMPKLMEKDDNAQHK